MARSHLVAACPAPATDQEASGPVISLAASADAHPGDVIFPCCPDRLLAQLPAGDLESRRWASHVAFRFAQTFAHMSVTQQIIVFRCFLYGAHNELAAQIQIEWSYLSRLTGLVPADLLNHLGGLHTMGFDCIVYEPDTLLRLRGQASQLILQWHTLAEEGMVNATAIAVLTMCTLIADRSEEAAFTLLQRLDFSSLAARPAEA